MHHRTGDSTSQKADTKAKGSNIKKSVHNRGWARERIWDAETTMKGISTLVLGVVAIATRRPTHYSWFRLGGSGIKKKKPFLFHYPYSGLPRLTRVSSGSKCPCFVTVHGVAKPSTFRDYGQSFRHYFSWAPTGSFAHSLFYITTSLPRAGRKGLWNWLQKKMEINLLISAVIWGKCTASNETHLLYLWWPHELDGNCNRTINFDPGKGVGMIFFY